MASALTTAAPKPWPDQPNEAGSDAATNSPYFFGPIRDFLFLGGSSLLLLPVALLLPSSSEDGVSWLMLAIALFINHPHFAHSYQIFYRGFRDKIDAGPTAINDTNLRRRYLVAGIIVPIILLGFLVAAVVHGNAQSDTQLLGLAGNAMAFFVGWHYVKQGYGMLIVDALRGRHRFTNLQRQILLVNAYAVWALTWISLNSGGDDRSLFGIESATLDLPAVLLYATIAIAAVTGAATGVVLLQRWLRDRRLPVNGLTAYLVTLYLWMVFVQMDAIWLLIVPALHSLQYLGVVYRFELNREADQPGAADAPDTALEQRLFEDLGALRFSQFVAVGFVIGLLAFWAVPLLLEFSIPVAASGSLFLFAFWVFINIHHYFIDNVIWRGGNPEVKRYLFSPPTPAPPPPNADTRASRAA